MIHLCIQLYAKIERIIIIINVSECLYCRMGSERLAGWLIEYTAVRGSERARPRRVARPAVALGARLISSVRFQGAPRSSVCLSPAVRAACISVSGLCRHCVFQWFCHYIRHPHVVTKKLIPNTIAQLQQYSFDFNVTSINIQCQNCSINRFISESCHVSYSWPGVVNTRLRWNLSSKFKFDA